MDHIRFVRNEGQRIEVIRKDRGFSEFCEFVETYEANYSKGIKERILRKNVNALTKSYSKILPDGRAAIGPQIFGYTGADEKIWQEENEMVLHCFSAADKERLEVLAYIREGLILFFGDNDHASQSNWIGLKREELGARSVWGLISSGSMADLFLAANFVNRVLG